MKRTLFLSILLLGLFSASWSAEPPEEIAFQGVLRDQFSGQPVDGTRYLICRLFDASGVPLLEDHHPSVQVASGLFHVYVGSGTLVPQLYASVPEVFANESQVLLELQIHDDPQPLSPRIPIAAAPYAHNAGMLSGHHASSFLDTSESLNTKVGTLQLQVGDEVEKPYAEATLGVPSQAAGLFERQFKDDLNITVLSQAELAAEAAGEFHHDHPGIEPDASYTTSAKIAEDYSGGSFTCESSLFSHGEHIVRGGATLSGCAGSSFQGVSEVSGVLPQDQRRTATVELSRAFQGAALSWVLEERPGESSDPWVEVVRTEAKLAGETYAAEFKGDVLIEGELLYQSTDTEPWTMKVDGQTALRLEAGEDSPNLIGGHADNLVGFLVDAQGGTIGGGGDSARPNIVDSDYGTVGGGAWNWAGSGELDDIVERGYETIGGGLRNSASYAWSTVGGGKQNSAQGYGSTVGGGAENVAGYEWFDPGLMAGHWVTSSYGTVGGGELNQALGRHSVVAGGASNRAGYFIQYPDDTYDISGAHATVPGGHQNVAAADFSFAAGRQAKVRPEDAGSFVWADATGSDFTSSGGNQFLVRAYGGVGINTATPAPGTVKIGTDLVVEGTIETTGVMGGMHFPDGSVQIKAATAHALDAVDGDPQTAVFVDAAGQVGIGTTSPSHQLTIRSADTETLRLWGPGSAYSEARLNFGDGDWVYIDEPVDDKMTAYADKGTTISSYYDPPLLLTRSGGPTYLRFDDNSSGAAIGTHRPYELWLFGPVTVSDTLSVLGSKNFVQPHPLDPSKQIRFTSLEGNESGTYFRGSSNLEGGITTIPVPEEFRLVSEETGLSVQLTPRGAAADLWVESVDLDQVVVRGDVDVAFDYVVNGVRRGFADLERITGNHSFVPRERGVPYGLQFPAAFRRILVENGTLNEDFTPNEDTAARLGWTLTDTTAELTVSKPGTARGPSEPGAATLAGRAVRGAKPAAPSGARDRIEVTRDVAQLPIDQQGNVYGRSFRPSAADLASRVVTSEPVEPGDVVVIDRENPGQVRRARVAADSTVMGVVAGEPGVVLGAEPQAQAAASGDALARLGAPVALSGLVYCKVDAGYGSIRPGDLLTTSPTPGHAQRAAETLPGTILGKALEPLEAGTGRIRIVVTLR